MGLRVNTVWLRENQENYNTKLLEQTKKNPPLPFSKKSLLAAQRSQYNKEEIQENE